MKKFFVGLSFLLGIFTLFICYQIWGNATQFSQESKIITIEEYQLNKPILLKLLKDEEIIGNTFLFEKLADRFDMWQRIKSGKFKFKKSDNLLTIVKALKNNKQVEINLVINKIRTPNDLAKLIGKSFASDSASALAVITNSKVLENLNADSNSFLFNIIPNTYTFYWNTPVEKMLEKLAVESNKFWDKNDRKMQAEKMGLSPYQVYTIASIVEEETNKDDEKGKVASVYLNRYFKDMKLDADPTVKFALKDFTLKRIFEKHLLFNHPYNTYRNKGLPPGAICTPSIKTIDAVLQAPKTDYLFFCADASFNGYHHFTNNYQEHLAYAKSYQTALNNRLAQ